MADAPIRVGFLGCGNVGGALIGLLAREGDAIARRTGVRLVVTRVLVRDPDKPRPEELDATLLTTEPTDVVAAEDVDVVVEMMGAVDPAFALLRQALAAGKPVVTANKELIAERGPELFAAASAAGRDLLFEAAVGGGIPLIRPLRESLAGEPLRRVMGIVNGTTNFVLTRMTEDGASYEAALADAQALGYAEPDPTADVGGHDAAAKAAIIASIAFGVAVPVGSVYREGIESVTATDIAFATRLGYVVKLLAVAELVDGQVAVRVHPAMVPITHPLAAVRDSFNAVFIEGEAVGELMLYGRGAGGLPTSSALLGDLLDAGHNLRAGGAGRSPVLAAAEIRPVAELESQYYLALDVLDRPGVLATVASVFGTHRISISSMEQHGLGDNARLVFITHTAREREIQATLEELRSLDAVRQIGGMLRVIGDES
ncbi:MAG TPA: homoserine dehydrogenase [Acidimicrobiales bacterium]|nr:homoserine dehydrogenase [Acidimicrobiales bacterium]